MKPERRRLLDRACREEGAWRKGHFFSIAVVQYVQISEVEGKPVRVVAVVCLDERLREAARLEGFTVYPTLANSGTAGAFGEAMRYRKSPPAARMNAEQATSRFRVLQFLSAASWGGTERMVAELVRGLNRERFSVEAAFFLGDGPVAEELRQEGVPVHVFAWTPWKTLRVAREMLWLFRRRRYHLVHAYGFKLNMLARPLARLAGVPVFVTGQRSVDLDRHPWHSWLDRLTSRWVDAYVSNSRAALDLLRTRERVDPRKLFLVYNGLPSRFFAPLPGAREELRRRWGVEEGEVVFLAVANLRPVKGHRYLLEALAKLDDRVAPSGEPGEVGVEKTLPPQPENVRQGGADGFRFRAVLVGEGELRGELEETARRLGLQDRVIFAGAESDVRPYLEAADVFVLPSLWEGFPVSIMEALARGLPVVATRVGGVPELLEEGVTGKLVPPGDPLALARALGELARDPVARRRMGEAGRRAVSDLTVERMCREVERVYLRLLERVASSPGFLPAD